MPYLWPPLRNQRVGAGTLVSDALQVGGMLSWMVGSAYGFHSNLDDIGLPVTNGGFLAGSSCLLADALLQARQFRLATPIERDEKVSLLADLLAGVLYVLAGGFGGYAMETGLIRFGNCCWLAGSLIGVTRPCLALTKGCGKGEPHVHTLLTALSYRQPQQTKEPLQVPSETGLSSRCRVH